MCPTVATANMGKSLCLMAAAAHMVEMFVFPGHGWQQSAAAMAEIQVSGAAAVAVVETSLTCSHRRPHGKHGSSGRCSIMAAHPRDHTSQHNSKGEVYWWKMRTGGQ